MELAAQGAQTMIEGAFFLSRLGVLTRKGQGAGETCECLRVVIERQLGGCRRAIFWCVGEEAHMGVETGAPCESQERACLPCAHAFFTTSAMDESRIEAMVLRQDRGDACRFAVAFHIEQEGVVMPCFHGVSP